MKDEELFLFIRPPRPLWPFNGAGSAFWPPLAFASLAAALRERLRDLRVEILDAPALEMGWRSLSEEVRKRRPAYVGIGEEAVSCREGLRVASLAREVGARVIAGGCFFGEAAPETLATGLVDVVVHNEGETTLVEVVESLRDGSTSGLRSVRGISFLARDEVVRTEPRPLIQDLDSLPLPAYDLLPVERYGRRSRSHRELAAIESSRGCSFGCDFCVLWRQMGMARNGKTIPRLRTKSPERLLEEVRLLMDRYGRRYLGWVDPCFNCDPEVSGRFAELLLRENRTIQQSAWVRADSLVRDEASGALTSCVRSGLNEVYIGIERLAKRELQTLRKGNLRGEVPEALRILSTRYPEVLAVGSFIYGLEGDTPESVRELARHATELPLDLLLFIPKTPLPGTPNWRQSYRTSLSDFGRSLSFLPTIEGSHARDELTKALYRSLVCDWSAARLRQSLVAWLRATPRKRGIRNRHTARSLRLFASGLWRGFRKRFDADGLYVPRWYES